MHSWGSYFVHVPYEHMFLMVDYSIIIIYKIVTNQVDRLKNETRKDNNYYFSGFSIFIFV